MAEVSQKPEPGSGRWSFLRRLPKLVNRGEPPKSAPLTAEEQRIQERREHTSSLINELMQHYGTPGTYTEQITGPDGEDATLETYYFDAKQPWMIKYGPIGDVKLSYRNVEGHKTYVRCSKAGPVSENPKTEAEKGIIYAGDGGMTDSEEMDTWDKWEPSIKALVDSPKAAS